MVLLFSYKKQLPCAGDPFWKLQGLHSEPMPGVKEQRLNSWVESGGDRVDEPREVCLSWGLRPWGGGGFWKDSIQSVNKQQILLLLPEKSREPVWLALELKDGGDDLMHWRR